MAELERWLEERIADVVGKRDAITEFGKMGTVASLGGKACAYREVLEWVRSRQPVGLTSEMRLRTHGDEPTTGEGE